MVYECRGSHCFDYVHRVCISGSGLDIRCHCTFVSLKYLYPLVEYMAQEQVVQEDAEREEFAWANQGPGTKLTGTFEGIIYAGKLSKNEAQNKTSFGVVLSNVSTDEGTLYVNDAKADDGFTIVEEETGKRATDYRFADPEDEGTTKLGDTNMISDRSGATFSPGEVSEDTIVVWYNGLSGQRVGRTLDFHGIPFAEYKEDGYLNKGLLQVCADWRTGNRSELARNGLAPRVARAPVPRSDLLGEEITVEIERNGRAYYAHVTLDGEEVDMMYAEDADSVLESEGINMHLYHGDGWQDRPANAQGPAPSFNIQVPGKETDEYGLNPVQQSFVSSLVSALEGTGHTIESAFGEAGGLEGLMTQHGVEGDSEAIRAAVHDRVTHLDPINE